MPSAPVPDFPTTALPLAAQAPVPAAQAQIPPSGQISPFFAAQAPVPATQAQIPPSGQISPFGATGGFSGYLNRLGGLTAPRQIPAMNDLTAHRFKQFGGLQGLRGYNPVSFLQEGGPVQHFWAGLGVFKNVPNLFKRHPGKAGVIGGGILGSALGAASGGGGPDVFLKKNRFSPFKDEELVVSDWDAPAAIDTSYLDLDPNRARSTVASRADYLTPDTAIRDPRVNMMGLVPDIERVEAGTVTAPGAYLDPQFGALEPGFEMLTDYTKAGRLKRQYEERLPLYEDLLGSGQARKDFTKSQMLFDIAGAGLNFAGGRGAGGENVATRSPAAQFAAAFSQVPKTIGERVAQQRQEELAIKSSALQAAEREEAQTRKATLEERKSQISFESLKSRETFAAKTAKLENETQREFQTRLTNVKNQLTAMLSNQSMLTRLQQAGLEGAIQERLAEVNYKNNVQLNATAFGQQVERELMQHEYGLTVQNRQLQADAMAQVYRTTYADLAQKRELQYRAAKANRDFDWEKDVQEWREKVTKDTAKFNERTRKDAFKLLDLKQDFMRDMQLSRDDLIEERRLNDNLRRDLGDQAYNQFITGLEEQTRQFEKSHGLAVTSQQMQEARWDMLGALEYMKQMGTPDLTEGPFGGKGPQSLMSNVFGNKDLWDRYAAGTLDADTESYLNAYITSATQSKWDPQLNQEVPGMLLPRPVLEAIERRSAADPGYRSPYLSREDPKYIRLEQKAQGRFPLN